MKISATYASKSSPGTTYVAQVHDDTGLLSCNCRGWITKKVGKVRECTHTRDLASEYHLTLEERDEQQFVVAISDPRPVKGDAVARPDVHTEFLQPMLASALTDGLSAAIGSDFVMEEKFDGHRIVMAVLFGKVTAWSRTEKSRTLPTHISELATLLPDGVYDGELIVPGKHSYDVTAGMNSGAEVLVLFDMLRALGQSTIGRAFYERRKLLEVAYSAVGRDQSAIQLVKQMRPSQAQIDAIWKRGGEGVILKRRSARYQPGFRSADWIKIKKTAAATLTIVGYEAGKVGPYSAVRIRDANGVETTVKTLDNATMRQMILDPQSFIGRDLVISYQERTPSGKYRHPMWDHLLVKEKR